MPTKDQERKALAQIEKILANLGGNPETSYLCRAFRGCCEDARENIENDFANSAADRAEYFEQKYNEAKQEAQEAREAMEAMQANADRKAAAQIEKEDLRIMFSALSQQIDAERAEIERSAAKIVEHAETPRNEEFISAVIAHRKHTNREKALYDCHLRVVQKLNRM
jgi:hypothetical protein